LDDYADFLEQSNVHISKRREKKIFQIMNFRHQSAFRKAGSSAVVNYDVVVVCIVI